MVPDDRYWMQQALEQAALAAKASEVPVGAVIVRNNQPLASCGNETIRACDPTAHAEIQALRLAAQSLGNYRLLGTTLYVTLEPCLMCWSAAVHARIERLVYAAKDPKVGVFSKNLASKLQQNVNHQLQVTGGVLAPEAQKLLITFFQQRRG
jgi:tRNA(adenine34) deaminase